MSEEEVDELFKSTIDASNDEVDYRGKPHHLHPSPTCTYMSRMGLVLIYVAEFVKTIAEN